MLSDTNTYVLTKDLSTVKRLNQYIYSILEFNDMMICSDKNKEITFYSLTDFKLIKKVSTPLFINSIIKMDERHIIIGGWNGYMAIMDVKFYTVIKSIQLAK